jgi:hypothetical protein
MQEGTWYQIDTLSNRRFSCGHCGEKVSSNTGYTARDSMNHIRGWIYVCHACNKPTYFTIDSTQTPGVLLGGAINHLPPDINLLYGEIRNSTAVNSYTAAVLSARKLLMHIAVELGADENKTFAQYVSYLVDNHYTPPNSKAWIDEIRRAGNEANHEIVIMDSERATSIIKLVEMLLRFNYEFPAEAGEDVEEAEA